MSSSVSSHVPHAVPPPVEDADAADRLLRAMRRIVHAVDIHSKKVERATGVTVPQLVVLQAIRSLGETTTGRIAAAASMSAATAVPVLDKLEARGLIERYRSRVDRRVVHARLTPAGEGVLAVGPRPLQDRLARAILDLDAADREAMVGALETVARLMETDAPA